MDHQHCFFLSMNQSVTKANYRDIWHLLEVDVWKMPAAFPYTATIFIELRSGLNTMRSRKGPYKCKSLLHNCLFTQTCTNTKATLGAITTQTTYFLTAEKLELGIHLQNKNIIHDLPIKNSGSDPKLNLHSLQIGDILNVL